MRRVLIFIMMGLLLSCEKMDDCEIEACGICNPQENIPWLKEFINIANTDISGNYVGTIWLEKYKSDDIFVTNMALGSGGVAYYFFDCQGNSFIPDNLDQLVNEMKLDVVIFSNVSN